MRIHLLKSTEPSVLWCRRRVPLDESEHTDVEDDVTCPSCLRVLASTLRNHAWSLERRAREYDDPQAARGL